MRSLFLSSLLVIMSATAQAQSTLPAGKGQEAIVGMGYNPDTQTFQGRCLRGEVSKFGQPVANIDFSQTLSQSDLANELGFSAGGKFRYGMAEVGASAKFFKQTQSSSFSISAVYSGDYKFTNLILDFKDGDAANSDKNVKLRLSDVGKSVYGNDPKWAETCGTEYVEQIERGAKLFYSIKIDFSSTEEKQQFEAAFSYESSFASAQANLKNASRNFSKNTRVTIGALQIGGDVSKITELFNAETDSGSALGFQQCTFGDFSKCDQVMATAWNYATKEFKKQLNPDDKTTPNAIGPAYLKYHTKKYSAAGVYGKLPSVVTSAIVTSRKQLERMFDKQMDYLGEVRTILYGKTVILSPRQRKQITAIEKAVGLNLEKLVAISRTCYDKPEDCIQEVNSLSTAGQGLVEVKETDLIIEPETFQQFCNLASTVTAPAGLKETIDGMIAAAKGADEKAFASDENGRTDRCLVAHFVFSRQSKMKFAEQKISTVAPLQEYLQFEELDLSGNSIEDLSPLAKLSNLKVLNLHKNAVRDLTPLSQLRSLEKLRVSNNSLRDISTLRANPALNRVDARNNFPTLTCSDLAQTASCLVASVRLDANFLPVSTKNSVPLFMPSLSRMDDGRVLVVGGGATAETYGSDANSFVRTGPIGAPSTAHVSTTLLDGRVLVTGGWGSLRKIAIYRPLTNDFEVYDSGLSIPRAGHQATLLVDGRVLISGGWEGGGAWTGSNASFTAEIFDPKTLKSTLIQQMHAPRAWHTSTRLDDGRVLIAGGFAHAGSLASAEIFDPATNSFTVLRSSMSSGRGAHSATALDDGRILLLAGFETYGKASDSGDLFDPRQNKFTALTERLNKSRGAHSAVKLANGRILVTGGSTEVYTPVSPLQLSNEHFLNLGEIFEPSEGSFSEVPAPMFLSRSYHSMIETRPGFVLIVGGLFVDASFSSEVFAYSDFNSDPLFR